MKTFGIAALTVIAEGILVLVLVRAVPRNTAVMIVSNRGPVEWAGVVLYVVAAVMYWKIAASSARRDLRGGLLLVAMALAELGLWKWIYRSGFDDAADPWYVPVGSAAVLLTVLVIAFRFIRDHWRDLLLGLRAGRWCARFAFVGLLLLAATVVVDPIQAHMWDRGPRGIRFVFGVAEETAELLVPALFVLALWSRFREGRIRMVISPQSFSHADKETSR